MTTVTNLEPVNRLKDSDGMSRRRHSLTGLRSRIQVSTAVPMGKFEYYETGSRFRDDESKTALIERV